jgi:acetyl esterase/lipase
MNLPFARLFASAAVAASALSWAASHPVVLVNALVPRDDCTRYVDLPYGADPRQRLDVYVPRQSAKHRPPMVVFFYGGSWQSGRRQDYLFVGEALASRGFVVVIPDYRLYPQVVFPGFMQDAAMAVSWARTHAAAYGADPERVFLAGHSAGAQIALLLTTDRSWLAEAGIPSHALAGAIGLAGPYDFLPLQDTTLERIFPPAVREASQPVRFVQGGEPPVFLGVGLRDTTVDPANTERLAARLRAKGDVVEVRRYPTLTHAMTVGSLAAPVRAMGSVVATAPVLDDVVAFVNTH